MKMLIALLAFVLCLPCCACAVVWSVDGMEYADGSRHRWPALVPFGLALLLMFVKVKLAPTAKFRVLDVSFMERHG